MSANQQFEDGAASRSTEALSTNPGLLNQNHRVRLRLTFQHIDSILNGIEQIFAEPERSSPFCRYTPDITPVQRRIAVDYIARVRATMAKIMTEQAIEFAQPDRGARWGALTAVLGASISAEELTPDRMRGYGEVSVAGHHLLEVVQSELNLALRDLQSYLEQCGNGDLEQRIENLEDTEETARLIKKLDRVIATHGLVEYRHALATIVDKVETKTLEVAVFGRVSSGKSSLLNYLLGMECLPVDVTPVTAVPTRIRYGQQPRVTVEFADDQSRVISISDLWDFATERGNPNNVKHVVRILVEVPVRKLPADVVFVDTPGLGALTTNGITETLAYLPRCDLGILMLDASSGIAAEDCAVLDALARTGSRAVILISKSDLYEQKEREKLIAYVTDAVKKQLSLSPPIFPVSVVGEGALLCDNWLREYLEPQLQQRRQLIVAATNRKLTVLRHTIMASLEAKLAIVNGFVPSQQSQQHFLVDEFRDVERLLASSSRECAELCREIEDQFEPIIEKTAEALVTRWLKEPRVAPTETVAAKVSEMLMDRVSGIAKAYWRAQTLTTRALEAAEKASPKGLSLELPGAVGMPPLDPTGVTAGLTITKPALLSVITASTVKRHIQQQIRREIGPSLNVFLGAYCRQLRTWFREAISNLRTAFQSAATIYRFEFEPAETAMPKDRAQLAADLEGLKSETRASF